MRAPPFRRPRIFFGWYIILGHMVLHFYMSTVFIYGMGSFFNPIIEEMGWTRAQLSFAAGLQPSVAGIAAPVVGFMVDAFGARKLAITGVLLAGLGLISMSQVTDLWMFYATYLLVAAGMSFMIGVPFAAAAANWFSRKLGRAMGILFFGATFSGLFVPLVALGVQELGWRETMLLCGLGLLVVGFPAAAVARHRPEPYGYLPDGDDPSSVPASERSPSGELQRPALFGYTVKEALRTPVFWIMNLVFGLSIMGPMAMFLHQIPYFENVGFSPTVAASTTAAFTLLSGIGRVGGGWLMDLVDRRLVLAAIIAVQALGFVVLLYATEYWHSILYALLVGVSFGAGIPARPVFARAFFGNRAFGALSGLMQSSSVIGGVLGPVLMGWVFDTTGSYGPAVVVLAVVTAIAAPLALVLRVPARMRQETST